MKKGIVGDAWEHLCQALVRLNIINLSLKFQSNTIKIKNHLEFFKEIHTNSRIGKG